MLQEDEVMKCVMFKDFNCCFLGSHVRPESSNTSKVFRCFPSLTMYSWVVY